jgi:predicted nucleic acid-binding protein
LQQTTLQHGSGYCVTSGMSELTTFAIYLDSNVFIELIERHNSPEAALIRELYGEDGRLLWRLTSSELTLAEVLVKPIMNAQASDDLASPEWQVVDTYRQFVSNIGTFQRIVPVSRDILDLAANVRAMNKTIKLPDAIHVATAMQENCKFFVSNDKRIPQVSSDGQHSLPLQFVNFADLQDRPIQGVAD